MWQMLIYGLYYYHGWSCQYFESNEFSFIRENKLKSIDKRKSMNDRFKDIRRVPYERRKEQNRSYAKKYRDNNKDKINNKLKEKRYIICKND